MYANIYQVKRHPFFRGLDWAGLLLWPPQVADKAVDVSLCNGLGMCLRTPRHPAMCLCVLVDLCIPMSEYEYLHVAWRRAWR